MKTLNEYLNTNVKIKDEFKKFETKEEICDFLENKGFEKNEIDPYSNNDHHKMIDDFGKSNTPLFYVTTEKCFGSWDIRFGKDGKDNYIFFWRIPESRTQSNYIVSNYKDNSIYDFTKFEDFEKYVKNYFGW